MKLQGGGGDRSSDDIRTSIFNQTKDPPACSFYWLTTDICKDKHNDLVQCQGMEGEVCDRYLHRMCMASYCKRHFEDFNGMDLCMKCSNIYKRRVLEGSQGLSPVLLDDMTPRRLFGAEKDGHNEEGDETLKEAEKGLADDVEKEKDISKEVEKGDSDKCDGEQDGGNLKEVEKGGEKEDPQGEHEEDTMDSHLTKDSTGGNDSLESLKEVENEGLSKEVE